MTDFERETITAPEGCPLAAVLRIAQDTELIWTIKGGTILSHMMIMARNLVDDIPGQGKMINKFMRKGSTQGALMAASILCVECPGAFCIDGRNYKQEFAD